MSVFWSFWFGWNAPDGNHHSVANDQILDILGQQRGVGVRRGWEKCHGKGCRPGSRLTWKPFIPQVKPFIAPAGIAASRRSIFTCIWYTAFGFRGAMRDQDFLLSNGPAYEQTKNMRAFAVPPIADRSIRCRHIYMTARPRPLSLDEPSLGFCLGL
jgi:hypothetical protein